MASKSQSPATTSQPKQTRSRKAAIPSEQSAAGRAGSAGGIILEKEQAVKPKTSSTTAKSAAATASPSKDQDDAAATGPNRPRRKPRKLNREPVAAAQPTATTSITSATASHTSQQPSTAEIEALKSRVRGLEAKVEELYTVAESRGARSPRRRGKGRKGSSSAQVPTLATTSASAGVEDEEEADEELVRLEDELEVARRDLESFHPRLRLKNKSSTSGDTEYVEEIPRDDIGGGTVEGTVDRQVTLSGSYRIPLPASVSMNDVKTIQSGVSAAQNVARSFLDQRRAAAAARAPSPATAAPPSRPKATKRSSANNMEVNKEEGKSWGEWFGGYSVAISRAVKNIEAEAALESQKAGAARTTAPSAGKKSAAAAASKRPKARTGNLSSEQVQGLMR